MKSSTGINTVKITSAIVEAKGTPRYIAPERLKGQSASVQDDQMSDVYRCHSRLIVYFICTFN